MYVRLNWSAFVIGMLAATAAAQTTVTNSNNGTNNTVPVYTGSATLGNSPISVSGGNVGIGTTGPGNLLNVYTAGGSSPVGAMSVDVGSFGTGANAAASYFFRVRDIGAASTPFYIRGDGNVGIGTNSPSYQLEVLGGDIYSTSPYPGTGQIPSSRSLFLGTYNTNQSPVAGAGIQATFIRRSDTDFSSQLGFYTSGDNIPAQRMEIDQSGNVGIGTTSPGASLEVNGNVKLTANSGAAITFQDGTTQSTAYTGVVCGGDYAESVDVTGNRKKYEPGDVLVVDPHTAGKFLKASQPYSTLVAGIYSTKPGTVGRRQTTPKSPDEVPMAMMGIVPTKVTTENGPIAIGDLLVASSTPGRAMKGTDRNRLTGAVIGKALGPLDSGTGTIEVLVTLQ